MDAGMERVERASLASRRRRLLGALVDLTLGAAVWAACRVPLPLVGESELRWLYLSAPLLVVQAALVSTRGQSIGKLIAGTRIERQDGRRIGLVHGVVLRSWLMGSLHGFLLVFLADALWIFGRERRCLHDYFADTRVVDALRRTT